VLLVPVLLFSLSLSSPVTGVVVDPAGRPIPRASIGVTAPDGSSAGSIFTDADGAFRLADAPEGCRVRASLTGFEPATADCRSDAPVTITLALAPVAESIVVSATRTDAPSSQVGSAVTVFDEREIERRQVPPLADLLREAPGVTVVRSGAPGSVTSLFVRGGESSYTKVLLDGIPLNEPGGAFNMSNITTENLERVEFVRGANSAIYGSDAMTGVLQLFTRRGRETRPVGRVAVEGGSFSTTRASAGVSGRTDRVDYSADAAGLTTDNEVENNAFRNLTLSGSAGASLGRGATLRFIGRAERGRAGVPGQTAFGRADSDAFFRRHDGTFGLTFDQTSGALHQRASYGLAISHQVSANAANDPAYTPAFEGRTAPFEFSDFPYDSRTDLRRHHASYQADATIDGHAAGTHVETALVDWDGERADLRDALAATTVPASRDNVGVTLQHQALWPRAFITAGVRFEHNESFGSTTVPRVSAAWYVRQGSGAIGVTSVRASAGRGIKEPTVLQSFSPSPFFLGNPDLLPEKTRAFEIGVEQRLAGDRVRVDLAWFDNRYRDIIALKTDFATFHARYFNIGLTTARGAELSGDVALVSGFRAKAGYTFTDSRIVDSTSTSPVFQPGNSAFRRPRHAGFTSVSWNGGRASIALSGSLVGRRVDSDFSSLVPAIVGNVRYAAWDLRGSFRVTRLLSATAAVDNLTGSDHMEPLGYPVLGRAVRAGLRARF
jgi:outer membrane cobalamin receptor